MNCSIEIWRSRSQMAWYQSITVRTLNAIWKIKRIFTIMFLYKHPTLPLGEFAIGTNTTAYIAARKYGIADKMPILIAEKMGPHFAVGDTCYSWCEDIKVYNPNGKEIIARDNSVSIPQKRRRISSIFPLPYRYYHSI